MERDPVQWLYDLQQLGVKLGLDNIRALLAELEHPERAYPCLHIAGTNGKGSVAAMLSAMLHAAGVRPGMFTSPHLVRPNERVRIDERDIRTPELHRELRAMRRRIETGLGEGRLEVHPSFFETITATALSAFRRANIAAGVLEVGLGGRLDATNAVEGRTSVIVTLGLDHMKTLGGTLELIAEEKAGIVKPGRPLVTGVEQPEALAVLRRVCAEREAPLIEVREHAKIEAPTEGTEFTVRTNRAVYDHLRPALAGRHQRFNTAVAIVTLETFMESIGHEPPDPDTVRNGLAAVRWPGRLQWLPGTPPLLLDGAHNAGGAETLAAYLDGFTPRAEGRPLARPVMLFGAMRGKDLDGILAPLAKHVERVVVTRPGVERAADSEEVLAAARHWIGAAETVPEPEAALDRARALAAPDRYVLVAGSLYLVGQVLGLLEREPVPGPVSM